MQYIDDNKHEYTKHLPASKDETHFGSYAAYEEIETGAQDAWLVFEAHMFRSEIGPCRFMDQIGLDTVAFIEDNYIQERGLGGTLTVDWLRKEYLAQGRLGLKSDKGSLYPPQTQPQAPPVQSPQQLQGAQKQQQQQPTLYFLDVGLGGNLSQLDEVARNGKILRRDGRTAEVTTVMSGQPAPDGIDMAGDCMYWTNMGANAAVRDGSVMSSRLDGSDVQTVMPAGQVYTPKQLVAVPSRKQLYFCGREAMGVHRCGLDGKDHEVLVQRRAADKADALLQRCVSITVDERAGKAYWTDRGEHLRGSSLNRASLSGPLDLQRRQIFVTDLGRSVYSVDVDSGAKTVLHSDDGCYTGIFATELHGTHSAYSESQGLRFDRHPIPNVPSSSERDRPNNYHNNNYHNNNQLSHNPPQPAPSHGFLADVTNKVDLGEDIDFVVGLTASALTADQVLKLATSKDHKTMHLAKAGLAGAVAATAFTMMAREHREHRSAANHGRGRRRPRDLSTDSGTDSDRRHSPMRGRPPSYREDWPVVAGPRHYRRSHSYGDYYTHARSTGQLPYPPDTPSDSPPDTPSDMTNGEVKELAAGWVSRQAGQSQAHEDLTNVDLWEACVAYISTAPIDPATGKYTADIAEMNDCFEHYEEDDVTKTEFILCYHCATYHPSPPQGAGQ
ncbi:hypothetical protein B0T26DRAFT_876182 [Lasiosphaeria miniovina]|uniref:Uncharacterized protein n=1 Tax=Lasiosphaeria miniovina TaxID=1954250 RepID=A0AA39ZT25_9PEZI|nr:uncharacterized protein B0T26DRAFT_876182 [Lasiosphaeria miniovina]KAK0702999.1 hypothetical protein B0T26DRAFT_876182 [Lasiosphaeria miniovina]